MTTKAERLKTYRATYPEYSITNLTKMTQEQIAMRSVYGSSSLYELYDKPSQAKVNSWEAILRQYNPQRIIAVAGSCHTYSVLLVADRGVTMLITRDNNYLVEVV